MAAAIKGTKSKVSTPIVKRKAKSDVPVMQAEAKAAAKVPDKKAAAAQSTDKSASKASEAAASKGADKKVTTPITKRKSKAKAKSAGTGAPEGKKSRPKRKSMAKRLEEAQAAADKPKEAEDDNAQPRGVIYLAHIPTGFYEPQMKKFFGQFGKVTRVRLCRSKKNAALKGYGWIEFLEEDVAKVVQQTMNGYLLFGKQLKCEMVPKDKQHSTLFKGCRKKMVNRTGARRSQFKKTYNNRPTAEVDGEILPRETTRQHTRRGKSNKKLSEKLASLGVKYDLESVLDGAGEGDVIEFSDAAKKAKGGKRQVAAAGGTKAKKQKQQ